MAQDSRDHARNRRVCGRLNRRASWSSSSRQIDVAYQAAALLPSLSSQPCLRHHETFEPVTLA
jgi:hypothetical protein